MCGESVNIPTMPFVEHMVFAGLLQFSNNAPDSGGGEVVAGMDKSPPVTVDGDENSALGRFTTGSGSRRWILVTMTLQMLFLGLIS